MKSININIVKGGKYIHIIMFIRLILAFIGLGVSIILFVKDISGDFDNDIRTQVTILGFLAILLFILHLFDKKYITRIKGAIPITRFNIIDKNIKSKIDIFSDGIISTNPSKISVFDVHIEMGDMENNDVSGYREPVLMRIYKTRERQIIEDISTKIEPKSIINMEFLIKPDEKFNFQFNKNGILRNMVITEIYAP